MRSPICSSSSADLQVRGHDHRALGRIALVDDRVELLEHPVAALLGAEVVDVQQVDRGQPVEELEVGELAGRRRRRCAGSGPAAAAASRSRPSGPASIARLETSIASVVLPVPTSPSIQRPRPSAILRVEIVGELARPRRPPRASPGRAPCRRPAGGRSRRPGTCVGSTERTPRVRACWMRRSRHSQGRAGSRRRRPSRCRRRPRAGTRAAASRPWRSLRRRRRRAAASVAGAARAGAAVGVARGRRTTRTCPGRRASPCRSARCGSCARSARRSLAARSFSASSTSPSSKFL